MALIQLGFLLLLALSTHSTVLITQPVSTEFQNNQIPYFYANFGQVKYGKSQNFDLVKVDHSLCGDISTLKHLTLPSYVLVEVNLLASTCSFTKRAVNAQIIGAKGIIMGTQYVNKLQHDVVLTDDGNGRKVHITTLFINQSTYNTVAKYDNLKIIVNFPIVKSKISKVHLFLSASKRENYVFLRNFYKYYQSVKELVKVEPIYQTIECAQCPPESCFLSQKYCTFDYANFQLNAGSAIIKEQLIQYNIWRIQGIQKWFEYMDKFDDYCEDDWFKVEACSAKIRKELNITIGGLYNDDKDVMDAWRINEKLGGFYSVPEVSVNNLIYRGNFDAKDVFEMICSSLETEPKGCKDQSTIVDPRQKSGFKVWQIILVSLGIIIVLLIGVCVYRKLIKKELTNDMSSKVSELVARYATKVSQQNRKRKERLTQNLNQEL